MIVRRLVENINVARRGANPARITVRQSGVVVAQRFGTVNITQIGNTETVVAAEALGGHRAVTVDGYYAGNNIAGHAGKILGITTGAASAGAVATVQTHGKLTEPSWNWLVGSMVFLSTNGQLTQTPPTDGFRIILGRPVTATTLFVDISEPINLG